MKKYGVWKTRYAYNSRKYVEGWLKDNNRPLFFEDKISAEKCMRKFESIIHDMNTQYEVRAVHECSCCSRSKKDCRLSCRRQAYMESRRLDYRNYSHACAAACHDFIGDGKSVFCRRYVKY